MFIRFQKVYFGYGTSGLDVATLSAAVFSVRQVELWKCTFEDNTFRVIFRNTTFINTPILVMRFRNVTFINAINKLYCYVNPTHTSAH